jgi:hypothetical protein
VDPFGPFVRVHVAALPPMKISSTSTSPDRLNPPSCIASRIRWFMNQAVFCVTLRPR